MALCLNDTAMYAGRAVILEYAVGCPDAKPLEAAYKFVGASNTKSFTLGAETVDSTTDQTTGGVKSSIVTYINFECSVDGKVRLKDKAAEANAALLKYFVGEVAAARQPSAWIRLTFPDVTIEAYCNISNYERSAPDSDLVTFSASFQATESDFGVTVVDTI